MARQSETAVLVMTDLHYGKQTSTFGPDAFPKKLEKLGDRMARIRDLLHGEYDIDKLVILCLGDVNDGTDIYKTQAHHQRLSNVEEQAENLTNILAPWAIRQKDVWGDVAIETVPGNHGRAGAFTHEAASWDVVAYRYWAHKVAHAGIPVVVDKNDLFLRNVKIRGHKFLMYHGHGVRMFQGIPWYGIMQRVLRWSTTDHMRGFEAAVFGHFHYCGQMPVNSIQVLMSGTMVTGDEWALQELGLESSNAWHLFGVSDKRPITWQYQIDLT